MPKPPILVDHDIYRRPAFGAHHPLAIPRLSAVMDLCAALGWQATEQQYRCSPTASVEQLLRFHTPEYIDALRLADEQRLANKVARETFNIGTMENPVFAGVFERAATTVGGSILAAELAFAGNVVFHPAGGTHHGRPDRASGFCYFNDPVFALTKLCDLGVPRILYLDLDAHHGDGVEDAFLGDPRVLTISIHESGRWPYSGTLNDADNLHAGNFPVPRGCTDAEFDYLISAAVLPLARRFNPEAVVITCGADGLDGDPLSGMRLTNTVLWDAVQSCIELAPRAVVLGGGGYNPWTTARCWAGLWARLCGFDIPEVLPENAQAILRRLECDLIDEEDFEQAWVTTLADARRAKGQADTVRAEVKSLVERDATTSTRSAATRVDPRVEHGMV